MKTPIAVTLILAGAALVVAPIVKSQLQLQRVVEHYEQHGEGTQVPEECVHARMGLTIGPAWRQERFSVSWGHAVQLELLSPLQ
jgi:hypothetical protein